MALSETQEASMQAQRAARNKQDPKHPFLIHIEDASLLPNVPALRGRPAEKLNGQLVPSKPGHPKYRVYTGDPKASEEERLRWLESSGQGLAATDGVVRRAVILSDEEPFDLGTATLDEMIEFAKTEYKVKLDKTMGMKAVRKHISELAVAAGAAAEASLG